MMRFYFTLTFFCFPLLASCKDNPEPSQILQKAIEAHGGEKNINKPRKGIIKAESKDVAGDNYMEEIFDFPKQSKRITISEFQGKRKKGYNLMIDGKNWEWEEGHEPRQTIKNPADTSPDWSSIFLINLKKETVKLTAIDGIKVEGKSAVGFRATSDSNTGDYYFYKHSGLVAQTNFKLIKDGKEYQLKIIFLDYKEVDGFQFAYRRIIYIKGGNFDDYVKLLDLKVTENSILDKLPDDAFALPMVIR